ncbi:unnamed protein product [Moneuplotes crassus]|uniref:Spt4/RpoE2 zinc finger domain-containing protein n=1 Tax=Euplotes crassus TaxID=5936 RepID=A0AAD1Y7Y7_EUPCR|nr:unnamed protein product [Moneuplotes crassus]
MEAVNLKTPPSSMRKLRACLICSLIKTEEQFYQEGCDNCATAFDGVDGGTTPNFSGMISMMDPDSSWVARYKRLQKLVPGCYAVDVQKD